MFSAAFSYPHSITRLAPGEIHLWCADLDRAARYLPMLARTLSADELARARRFHFENDRTRFILRRGILRMSLANYLDVAPSLLRFSYGRHGKPALDGTLGKGNVFFNLSHSNGITLYAFARDSEVGVDIEQVHAIDDLQSIAARFFSPTEYQTLASLPDDRKQKAFFNCWTRKEAFVKAKGVGFTLPLDSFEVTLAPGEPARLLQVGGNSREASHWALCDLQPSPGYVGALAVEGHSSRVARWHWV
jgi:4'-phosphopantetheinyl transferase